MSNCVFLVVISFFPLSETLIPCVDAVNGMAVVDDDDDDDDVDDDDDGNVDDNVVVEFEEAALTAVGFCSVGIKGELADPNDSFDLASEGLLGMDGWVEEREM